MEVREWKWRDKARTDSANQICKAHGAQQDHRGRHELLILIHCTATNKCECGHGIGTREDTLDSVPGMISPYPVVNLKEYKASTKTP